MRYACRSWLIAAGVPTNFHHLSAHLFEQAIEERRPEPHAAFTIGPIIIRAGFQPAATG